MRKIFKSPSYSAPAPEATVVEPAAQRVEAPTADNNIAETAEKKKKRYGFAKTVGSVTGGDTLGA